MCDLEHASEHVRREHRGQVYLGGVEHIAHFVGSASMGILDGPATGSGRVVMEEEVSAGRESGTKPGFAGKGKRIIVAVGSYGARLLAGDLFD